MAGGRQRRLGKALGMFLALCLAGTGCRSTPLGQAVFGSRDDSSSPKRFALVRKQPDPPAASSAPSEQIVWHSASPGSGQTEVVPVKADSPGPALLPVPEKQDVTPAAFRSQAPPLEFPTQAPEGAKDNPPKTNETLPAPRPLPGPDVPLETALPTHGIPGPMVHGMPGAPVPHELNMMSLPTYTVEPPDILLVESSRGLPTQPVRGQHLVRPDGTINLGIYGSVYVTGMTLEQIRGVVAQAIAARLEPKVLKENPVKPEDVSVDVLAYNSKVYYVITDGGGYGEQVYRVPVTGNERVLDAIAQINGLPAVSSKRHIWVARRVPGHGAHDQTLPVDWCGITQRGEAATNYQIFPGDRVYVKAQSIIRIDSTIAKILSPIERLLGVTLLGSETVNSIRNRGTTTGP